MENKVEKIVKELKKTKLIQEGLKHLENSRLKTHFIDEFENKISVYNLISKYETTQGGQITGMITISVCNLFMKWLVLRGNEFLKSVGSNLIICDRYNLVGDEKLSEYDVCFELDGEKCFFEIKFSQNDNKTQGATHGKNKVDNFLIIEFKFDSNRVISENNIGILGDVWIGTTYKKPTFIGLATENNSRTSFSYTYKEYSVDEMNKVTILGSVFRKDKNSKKYKLIGGNIYN
jgi:hypothetical protein